MQRQKSKADGMIRSASFSVPKPQPPSRTRQKQTIAGYVDVCFKKVHILGSKSKANHKIHVEFLGRSWTSEPFQQSLIWNCGQKNFGVPYQATVLVTCYVEKKAPFGKKKWKLLTPNGKKLAMNFSFLEEKAEKGEEIAQHERSYTIPVKGKQIFKLNINCSNFKSLSHPLQPLVRLLGTELSLVPAILYDLEYIATKPPILLALYKFYRCRQQDHLLIISLFKEMIKKEHPVSMFANESAFRLIFFMLARFRGGYLAGKLVRESAFMINVWASMMSRMSWKSFFDGREFKAPIIDRLSKLLTNYLLCVKKYLKRSLCHELREFLEAAFLLVESKHDTKTAELTVANMLLEHYLCRCLRDPKEYRVNCPDSDDFSRMIGFLATILEQLGRFKLFDENNVPYCYFNPWLRNHFDKVREIIELSKEKTSKKMLRSRARKKMGPEVYVVIYKYLQAKKDEIVTKLEEQEVSPDLIVTFTTTLREVYYECKLAEVELSNQTPYSPETPFPVNYTEPFGPDYSADLLSTVLTDELTAIESDLLSQQ